MEFHYDSKYLITTKLLTNLPSNLQCWDKTETFSFPMEDNEIDFPNETWTTN